MGGKGSGRRRSDIVVHGVVRGYTKGCRCAQCRGAWAAYMRKRRAVQPKRQKQSFYPGRAAERSIKLTPLGDEILSALQAREHRGPGDIFEHLLRLHGRDLHFASLSAA